MSAGATLAARPHALPSTDASKDTIKEGENLMKELNVIGRAGRPDGRGAGLECVSAITKEPRHFCHLAHVPRVNQAIPVERALPV